MTDQYLERYHGGTLDQRRGAILKLGKSGDPRAIPLLEAIADSDRDPELRTLADKGLQHLQAQIQPSTLEAAATSAVRPTVMTTTARPSAVEILPPIVSAPILAPGPVSEQKRRMAKSQLDHVLTLKNSGNTEKALSMLADAYHNDPEILDSEIGRNLAMMITGESIDGARAVLVQQLEAKQNKRGGRSNGGAGRAGNRGSDNMGSTGSAMTANSNELLETVLELVIFFIVTLMLYGLITAGVARMMSSLLSNMSAFQSAPSNLTASEFALAQMTPSAMLRQTLESGVGAMFSTLLSTVAVYVVGTFMGGVSPLLRFIRVITRVYIGIDIFVLIGLGLIVLGGNQLASALPAITTATGQVVPGAQLPPGAQAASALIAVGGGIAVLSGIIGFFVLVSAVGRVHEIGFFRGFVSIIAGSIVLCIGSVILSALSLGGNPSSFVPQFLTPPPPG